MVEALVRGYFAYHAVPTNIRCLDRFRTEIVRAWLSILTTMGPLVSQEHSPLGPFA
jgi:RNA-directed DNA polymerase